MKRGMMTSMKMFGEGKILCQICFCNWLFFHLRFCSALMLMTWPVGLIPTATNYCVQEEVGVVFGDNGPAWKFMKRGMMTFNENVWRRLHYLV